MIKMEGGDNPRTPLLEKRIESPEPESSESRPPERGNGEEKPGSTAENRRGRSKRGPGDTGYHEGQRDTGHDLDDASSVGLRQQPGSESQQASAKGDTSLNEKLRQQRGTLSSASYGV
jgi:hypothetical protein